MDIRNSDNEFIEDSLDEFEEHLDSHFGDTALPDLKVDDCLTVNDHKVTPKQAASIDGRKVVGGPRRAAISEEPTLVVGRGGERRPYGYGHEVPLPPRKPCPISEHAKANPVRSNLRVRSPRLPDLDATEEAELFQKTRDGDEQAGRKLIDHFHGWVRYAAWKPWLRTQKRNFKTAVVSNSPKERAETIDDYVAAGMLALWEAIRGYASGANNKFNAYARKRVYGAISNVAWAHKAGGIKSETDLARFIRSHFNSPLDVLKKFAGKYTPPQVYQEIARQGLLVGERDDYSEGSTSDQGSDSENQGCHIAGSAGTPVAENGLWYWRSHDGKWVRYDAFNKHALSPHLRHHGLLSKHIDAAALDADLRARRRLREIGRPAYAQELVDKEQKYIADHKKRDAEEWKRAQLSRAQIESRRLELDGGKQWKNSATIKQKEKLDERKSGPEFGLVGANAARNGSDHRLSRHRNTAPYLRTSAAISNRTGRPETRPR